MAAHERWISKYKVKGGTWVFVPNKQTADYGLSVKRFIQRKWKAPSYYFHLRGGGHVAALNAHTESKYFLHLDIKGFFGCINRSRVTRCLKSYLSYKEARDIALESTVRVPDSKAKRYVLPFGFVQSPMVASLCLDKSALGGLLSKLAGRGKFKVSVYMDDIIVSANELQPLRDQLEPISSAAKKSGFPLNPDKQEGPGERVTAFNICMSHRSLSITEQRLMEFVRVYASSSNEDQKKGIRNYILSVCPDQLSRLPRL